MWPFNNRGAAQLLLPQLESREVLERLGFRCIEPTVFTVRNGVVITVHANGWMLAKKELPETEAEAGCLRLYTVYYPGGGSEELDEHDVASLVGKTNWSQAR